MGSYTPLERESVKEWLRERVAGAKVLRRCRPSTSTVVQQLLTYQKPFLKTLSDRELLIRCADVPAYDSMLDSTIHGLSFRPIPMVVGSLMLNRCIVQNGASEMTGLGKYRFGRTTVLT